MISVEIKINGVLVGHVYGRNTGTRREGKTLYVTEYYEPEKPHIQDLMIWHNRDDGIKVLLHKILEEAIKEDGKARHVQEA